MQLQRRTVRNREALVQAARTLFRAQGYDATSIDQIVAGAGVARSTFFRHFPTKEAVVFPHAEARLARFEELLFIEPEPGEAPPDTLRRSFMEMADEFTENKDELLLQHELIATSPALLAFELELDRRWEETLARALEEAGASRLRARVLAGGIAGTMRAVLRTWFEGRARQDLRELVGKGFDIFLGGEG